jgi:hypothetical protein
MTVMTDLSARGDLAPAHARALLAMARPSQLTLIGLAFASGVLLALWRGGALDITGSLVAAALLLPSSVAVHCVGRSDRVAPV